MEDYKPDEERVKTILNYALQICANLGNCHEAILCLFLRKKYTDFYKLITS